ncbi:hypothetical protein [Streptomyces sp. UNOC14_S4]|uniref:hypothetical protein n=1 Tax=Streptomyces sp. UNOC14_S4 TaxID=2872340 RepID=UPI001E33D39F|nr:hypothetical protein [Streptomyces sp. UNOC14_S4]MCC3766555.1 hypothetical protein [Streptomyces sp. UNOC14_S4]
MIGAYASLIGSHRWGIRSPHGRPHGGRATPGGGPRGGRTAGQSRCWAGVLVSRYTASEGGKEAVIQVEPENTASAAVARRAGFAPGKHTHGEDGTPLDWYVRDLRVGIR